MLMKEKDVMIKGNKRLKSINATQSSRKIQNVISACL